jgi:hypothetical protein
MRRPTHKELTNKLRQALSNIENGRVLLLNQVALALDALELNYVIESELKDVLNDLLEKATPTNYTGRRPPQRSYEREISGLDLFAFTVEIDRFSAPVYFKFSLSEDVVWLVSLHQDR